MGTVQAPTLNGRANVDSGSITYLKRVFMVERGVIDFVNPYAIEPQVDIMGKIPIQDRIISIIVSGSPDNMVFKLECDDPGLEDQDIISLLVLGMTTYELQNDFQSGLSSGESNQQMLAALVASTFGEDIRNVTGLDVLEVETGDDDNDNSDRIAVTVGKQLTRRLGTKYTVETESGEVLQRATAEYRILQNLFLAGFQDTKGVFGGELRFTWQKR
jgi:autotransporter translocation and assembly factor TamB